MGMIDFSNMDKKSKIETAVTSVMVVVFILILSNSLSKIFSSGDAGGGPSYISADDFKQMVEKDIAKPPSANHLTAKDKYQDAIKEEDSIPWGRDPFSKKFAIRGGKIAVSDLKLEGILVHDDNIPRAVINGEIVAEKEKIGNATVVRIEDDSVTVTDGKREYKLHIW